MHDLLSSPLNSFIDLYAPYLTGFSHEECEIIKNSITEDMFVLSATKGNAVVKKAADDYRKGQVKDQLFRLWSERTGGTKSPKHWSEHYKTPILCCIDPEIYGEAKKAFAVLNSSQHSESEIKMALEFCEGADFFDVIADSDYRNKSLAAIPSFYLTLQQSAQRLRIQISPHMTGRMIPESRQKSRTWPVLNTTRGAATLPSIP